MRIPLPQASLPAWLPGPAALLMPFGSYHKRLTRSPPSAAFVPCGRPFGLRRQDLRLVVSSSDSHFLECFLRDAEAVDSRGDTAVDRHLQKDLLNVVFAQPVLDRSLDVNFDLVRSIERREHGQIEKASSLLIES